MAILLLVVLVALGATVVKVGRIAVPTMLVDDVTGDYCTLGLVVRYRPDGYVEYLDERGWIRSAPGECVSEEMLPWRERAAYKIKCAVHRERDDFPTAEEISEHEESEDRTGNYGQYPSPVEMWADSIEIHHRFLTNSIPALLRWRLSVAWMPFTRRRVRLLPKVVSRAIRPSLHW